MLNAHDRFILAVARVYGSMATHGKSIDEDDVRMNRVQNDCSDGIHSRFE